MINPKAVFAVINPNKFLDEYNLRGELGSGRFASNVINIRCVWIGLHVLQEG